MNLFQRPPLTLMLKIFRFLNHRDFIAFSSINKKIRNYYDNREIWKFMLNKDFPARSKGYGLETLKTNNPRELYKLLTKKPTIIEIDKCHYLKGSDNLVHIIFPFLRFDNTLETLQFMTDNIKNFINDTGITILPGDMVWYTWIKSDKGCYIWNGETILPSDDNINNFV